MQQPAGRRMSRASATEGSNAKCHLPYQLMRACCCNGIEGTHACQPYTDGQDNGAASALGSMPLATARAPACLIFCPDHKISCSRTSKFKPWFMTLVP